MPDGGVGRFDQVLPVDADSRARRAEIRAAFFRGAGGYRALAKRFGVSRTTVWRAVSEFSPRALEAASVRAEMLETAFCALPGVSAHARLRCWQRYGVDLTDGEWLQAVLDIMDGRAVLVRREATGVLMYGLLTASVPGMPVFVLYRAEAARIVTTAPPEANRMRKGNERR